MCFLIYLCAKGYGVRWEGWFPEQCESWMPRDIGVWCKLILFATGHNTLCQDKAMTGLYVVSQRHQISRNYRDFHCPVPLIYKPWAFLLLGLKGQIFSQRVCRHWPHLTKQFGHPMEKTSCICSSSVHIEHFKRGIYQPQNIIPFCPSAGTV